MFCPFPPLQEFRRYPQQAVVCSAGPGYVGALLGGSGRAGLYGHILYTSSGLLPQQGLPRVELGVMYHRLAAGNFTLHSDM